MFLKTTAMLLLACGALLKTERASAQCSPLVLKRTLKKPMPAIRDYLGVSVAVWGNNVVVGAYGDDTGGATDGGRAYLFDARTGDLIRAFDDPMPTDTRQFGGSVAISGNKVVVGSLYDDTGAFEAGSAYVFDVATGVLIKALHNPSPDAGDWFGYSVAISGDYVVVGAHKDDTGASDAGRAYLFDAASGTLLQTFENPTPAADDRFGYAVAISGNNVVVGAYWDDTGAVDAGSAYLFDAVSGALIWTFSEPTPMVGDNLGISVAVSGNNVLVGAYHDDTGATDAGSAYLFDATTGALLHTFNNPEPNPADGFGWSVAISGNKALVGAYFDDAGAGNAGSAYLFDAETGGLLQTFNNPFPAINDYFGFSVAVYGNSVVVGSYFDDTDATDAGSAFLYGCANRAHGWGGYQ